MIKLYLHGGKVSWKQIGLKLIQIGTDSPYFHVGIGYDKRFIIESTSKRGVDVRHINHYKNLVREGRIIDIYHVTEHINEGDFFDWLSVQNGLKYDKWGIIGLASIKLFGMFKAANKWQKDKDYFCSELAVSGLRKFSEHETPLRDIPATSKASPADIARSICFQKVGTLSAD